jgi:pimeloyl-ACP methyl ester carboxylesterase
MGQAHSATRAVSAAPIGIMRDKLIGKRVMTMLSVRSHWRSFAIDWRSWLIAALVAAAAIWLVTAVARPEPMKPVILLAYPGSARRCTLSNRAAEFAAVFRRHGYVVVMAPCPTDTAHDRNGSVRRMRQQLMLMHRSGQRIVVVAWSRAAWVAEVAALDGARVGGIVSVSGVQDLETLGQPLVPFSLPEAKLDNSRSPMRRDLRSLPPTLLLHSAHDPCTPISGVRAFYRRARMSGCAVTLIEGLPGHASLTRADDQVCYRYIAGWLRR